MLKKNFSSHLVVSFIILFVIIWGVVGLAVWKKNLLPKDIQNTTKTSFVISKGEGVSEISKKLQNEGLINDSLSFNLLTFSLGISKKIQAGTFYLSASMPAKEIAFSLTKGGNDKWVTFLEGLRQEQVGVFLAGQGFSVDPNLWSRTIKERKLEGKIFPDSYLFPIKADIETILKIIGRNFEKKVVVSRGYQMKSSNLDLNQVLILASIIEREAREEEDRRIVAGILLKRLVNDWPLQVDATIQYAVSSAKCKMQNAKCVEWWPKKLTEKDLKIVSPYNTYLNKGLPPAPICNPSLSAIDAVLGPSESPYWFYLSGSGGKIHYAKTDSEQAENIRKYLK